MSVYGVIEDFVEGKKKLCILHFSLAHRASYFPVCDLHQRQCFTSAPRVFRFQMGGFNPLLPPKRHPSFGWSSFHTAPISLCPWTWELTKAPRMWDVIGR